MKKCLALCLFLCVVAVGASAQQQQDKFTATRLQSKAHEDKALDGQGGMLIYSPHQDLVISVDPIECHAVVTSPRRASLDGETFYCYEVKADLSKRSDARFVFSRQGKALQTDLKQNLTRNRWEVCLVEEVANPIQCEELPDRNSFSGKEGVMLIEVQSTVPQLKVKPDAKLKSTITSRTKENDASVTIFSISIDSESLKAAKESAEKAKKDYEEFDRKLNAKEIDVDNDANWTRLDELKALSDQLEAELGGLYQIELSAPQSNKIYLSIEKMGYKERKVYGVNPLVETFASLLAKAQALGQDYTMHGIASGEYKRVADAYKEASEHIDCPLEQKDELMRESNKMLRIRQAAYKPERCGQLAQQMEARHGFNHDSVYIYLGAEYKHLGAMMNDYPEIIGLDVLQAQVWNRMQQHPMSKKSETVIETQQRQIVSGKVTRSTASSIPLSSLSIYATNDAKVSSKDARKESTMIGRVRSDGTYSVVIPDGYQYIFVDGEKTSHRVLPETTTLDINF